MLFWRENKANDLSSINPKDGDVFEQCRFFFNTPTEIFTGVKDLLFIECVMPNCILPDDATTRDCVLAEYDFTDSNDLKWKDRIFDYFANIFSNNYDRNAPKAYKKVHKKITDIELTDRLKQYNEIRKTHAYKHKKWITDGE